MQSKHMASDATKSEMSFVYYYLTAGIMLMIAVFLFVPRVSSG